MGRPPMPIGSYGKITTKQLEPKKWRAYARYRDSDGRLKPMQRIGTSKTNAENKLKEALGKVNDDIHSSTLDKNTRLKKVAESYLQELREETAAGEISANTLRNYTSWARNWIIPNMGSLVFGLGEVSVAACEGLVKRVRRETSLDGAKSCRAVLSAICGHALRHKLISHNPVRSTKRLNKRPEDQKEIRGMTLDERTRMIEALREYGQKKQVDALGRSLGDRGQVWLDLPDLAEAMLSTGVRIGEIVCVRGDDVTPATREVTFSHHLERVQGQGLVRKPGRKSNEPPLTLVYPAWSQSMWRRRKLASGGKLIFASWTGELLDESTLIHRLREALDASGFGWVTSRVWRKTVAGVLKEAGFSDSQIADQLGNTEAVARKHYIPPMRGSAAAATALEGMFPQAGGPDESAD
jgi:integrase